MIDFDLSCYEASVQWAKGLLQRDDWVVLDTETTGLGQEALIKAMAAEEA